MISVIIPAYNAEETLGACLEALESQTLPRNRYEIMVVDDGSTDGTADVAGSYGVRMIRQANAGPAAARNRGAYEARGELLLFTDADCAPARDWIERMADAFAEPEVVGAKGTYRTHQGALVARFVQLEYEKKYARMRHRDQIDFVDTYSAGYRRDVFLANDGFEARFSTSSVEDQEFSFRLARKGYRLVFLPEAVVFHVHDATASEYWRRKFNIGYWKALLLRWHPERAVRDSHTPQVLKVQILLAGLLCLSTLVAVLWRQALLGSAALLALFLLSTVPFVVRALRRDVPVASVAPLLLLVRSLALGLGLVAGFLRFRGEDITRRAPIGGASRAVKRVVDIVVGLMGLILSAPLLAVLAAVIKLDSPGPVFFVQERAGENGRPFRMVKLRTMVEGAAEIPVANGQSESSALSSKSRHDPRVTRVGWFLRRASLDELPQLWNVLKGEMSLVGPRPEELDVVRRYDDWHRRRLAVKPGLTGPMQVGGRADLELDERVRLELDYIENYSLWRDFSILGRTVGVVLRGRGAY
jgi:lipopolysaccharide/colanic/teichoic acid biosynthesis glycosyltransferase/GT2 family glycosyltransferase